MLVPFESLDANSKIWIYQSDRKLQQNELDFVRKNTEAFLTEWTAHGQNLQAGMQIFHEQFIVIGVNEAVNQASGCSIDKSVHFMQQLGNALKLDLLQRSKIAVKNENEIRVIEFSEVKEAINSGVISKASTVFNNAVVAKQDLDTQWAQPAQESWLKRYF